MDDKTIYLFAYGTLRRNCTTEAYQTYLLNTEFIDEAQIRATLFLVSYYPAIILTEENSWVRGEVYRLVDEQQLHTLDDYEGCTQAHSNPEYRRELVEVELTNGTTLLAWTYIYNQETTHLPLIESGDFLQR